MNRRLLARTLAAVALAAVSVFLIWAGQAVWEEGRNVSTSEARFATEYILASQLLWILSGGVVAGVIRISLVSNPKGSLAPLLVGSIVPLLMVLPTYVWFSPGVPSWLRQLTPTAEWLLAPAVQTGGPVLAGALLGTALWRRVWSSESLEPD